MSDNKIVILSQSEYFNDPRVLKQSVTAVQNFFSVDVFCYKSIYQNLSDEELYNGVNIHRINTIGRGKTKTDFIAKGVYYIITNVWNFFSKFSTVGNKDKVNMISTNELKTPMHLILLDFLFSYFISNFDIYFKTKWKKADIYHSTDLITLLAGFLLKKFNGGKLVYDTHELWIDSITNYPIWLKKILGFYEMFLIRRADVVVTVNESIAKELVNRYHISYPVVVLNCPVYSESSNCKKEDGKVHLLYHGIYIRERGLEEIIRSMQYVDTRCVLSLRGYDGYIPKGMDGDYLNELKKIVLEHGLEKRVEFLNPVAMVDMVKSIDNYDIGLMPYIPTNMNQLYASPNKTFEYMMGGLAVAVSNIPEQVRFVVENGIGMAFNPRDPNDISRVVNLMISDVKILNGMKEKALNLAKNKYNWEVQGEKLVEVYRKLVG
jgi:glycosyltransferase involved in cell wall biosynthesis